MGRGVTYFFSVSKQPIQTFVFRLLGDHFGIANDRVQWRSQLVGHVRQEFTLGFARRIGLVPGFFELHGPCLDETIKLCVLGLELCCQRPKRASEQAAHRIGLDFESPFCLFCLRVFDFLLEFHDG